MLLPYGFPLPPPPSTTPSIIPLSLPPPSHISELLISGASQSGHAPPSSPPSLPPSLPPVHFSFPLFLPPLAFSLPALLQQGPLPPSPMPQFTPKVSADPILPPSAIDVSLSEPLGSRVMQTRPAVGARGRGREEHTFPFINQQPTFVFIFMVS